MAGSPTVLRRALGAVRSLRRIPVRPPEIATDVGALEVERRRPIADELRRARIFGLAMLGLIGVLIVPSVLAAVYLSAGPSRALEPGPFFEWVRHERGSWDESLLLGLPVAVLVPSVLTVLFATGPSGVNGREQTAREEAFIELIRDLLFFGLCVGTSLALLAAIPAENDSNLPVVALALFIATGCAMLTGTLRTEGTQRDLLIVQAQARRDAALTERARVDADVAAYPRWVGSLAPCGPVAHTRNLLVLVVAVGAAPALCFMVWIGFVVGGPRSLARFGLALLALGLYVGVQAMFIVFGMSQYRLATSRREKLASLFLLAMPGSLLGFQVMLLLAGGLPSPNRDVLSAFAASLLIADLIALALGRTFVATVLDYRRLTTVAGYAQSQIDFLSHGEPMAEVHSEVAAKAMDARPVL